MMPSFIAAAVVAVLAATTAAGPLNDLNAFGYNPKADPSAVVLSTDGKARFTVLTDHVVRAEFSASRTFEDRATLAIVNRRLQVPRFTATTSPAGVTTVALPSGVSLSYANNAGATRFTAASLWGTSSSGAAWRFGDVDGGNLLGTIKSLDGLCAVSLNCTQNQHMRIHDESLHCAWGVVSRSGWTVIDDTTNYIMSGEPNAWFSNTDRSVSDADLYFFGHGLNFKQALQDFASIAGKAQVMSRPLLGSWYTRWYDFDQTDLTRLVGLYDKTSLPLDVLVLDMNWHTKNDWTGYSWDRQVFPYPADVLAYAKASGLMMAANLHDADGIGSWEDKYQQMCTAVGKIPGETPVPFQPMNRTYMHALDDIVLPNTGFDFYWIDWQQGGAVYGCAGERMNPTFITSHLRGTDGLRRKTNTRSNVLARFGGLGAHRYPVGFSGDVLSLTWECFRYQPYYSATAANVLFGSISHDLVGPADDHELHVRWMQFGAFSAVMRLHDRGMSAGACWTAESCAIVNLWRLPIKYLTPIRAAMTERLALLPYLYTEVHRGAATGLSMLRALYIDFPAEGAAYRMTGSGNSQYMLGGAMTVAPVVQQADTTTGLVQQEVWCPPGQWFDEVYGELVAGPALLQRQFTLNDVPRLVKAGTILPRLPAADARAIGTASRAYKALDIAVYPGAATGSYTLIEDDGTSYDYLRGATAATTLSYQQTGPAQVNITVSPATGPFATELPATRRVRVVFVAGVPVRHATVHTAAATKVISFRRFVPTSAAGASAAAAATWTYDSESAQVVLDLGVISTADGCVVSVSFAFSGAVGALPPSNLFTKRARLFAARTALAKRTLDDTRETPDSTTVGAGLFKQAASAAGALAHLAAPTTAAAFYDAMMNYTTLLRRGLDEVEGSSVELLQMYSAQRKDSLLCGSSRCRATNYPYKALWVEGLQPAHSGPNVVPLNDYYSGDNGDNWVTTASTPPGVTYGRAVFANGVVLKSAEAGTTCLQVWFSRAKQDHMTAASPRGIALAKEMGYSLVENCTGYVYTSLDAFRQANAKYRSSSPAIPAERMNKVKSLTSLQTPAFQRAIALLESCLA